MRQQPQRHVIGNPPRKSNAIGRHAHRGARLALVVAAALTGCRDHHDTTSRRTGDRDILAGRPPSFGGPDVAESDLLLRSIESRSSYLAPLRDKLRADLALHLRLVGNIDTAVPAGNNVVYDPLVGSTGARGTFGTGRGGPITLSLDALRDQYEQLCLLLYFGDILPWTSVGESGCALIVDPPLGVDLTIKSDQIDVTWAAPDPALGENTRNPVLEILLPTVADAELLDPCNVDMAVRVQVSAAPGSHPILFESYRHPTPALGDASFAEPGVVFHVQLTHRNLDGGACGAFEGALDGIDRVGTALLDPLLNVRNLNSSSARVEAWQAWCDDHFGSCPMASATLWHLAYQSIAAHERTMVVLPARSDDPDPAPIPLTGHDGRWTNNTIHALAEGANVVSATFDRSWYTGLCGSDYATRCTGAGRIRECDVCDFCAAPPAGAESLCDFASPITLEMSDGGPIPMMSIPASPELGQLIDLAPNIGLELDRIFSRPLERYRARTGEPLVYTDVLYCRGVSRPAECGGRTASALFMLDSDYEPGAGDGVWFRDNCPYVDNADQANADGDQYGDACDQCPNVASNRTADTDGDGLPDPCDCDRDSDACTNTGLNYEGAACVANGEDGTFDQRPLAINMLHPDGTPFDGDADGYPDDCDPDDDGDGIDDDVDNCVGRSNPGQEDTNHDGLGDACDPMCSGPGDERCDRMMFEEAGVRFHVDAILPGLDVLPDCLRDGPGCMIWWSLGADHVISYSGFDRDVRMLSMKDLGVPSVGPAQALVPDLDGDGRAELALASPMATACSPAPCRKEAGQIIVIGSAAGDILYRLAPLDAGAQLGTSLLQVGTELWAGAPGQLDAAGRRTGAIVRFDMSGGKPRVVGTRFGRQAGERFGARIVPVMTKGQITEIVALAPLADTTGAKRAGRIEVLDLDGGIDLELEGIATDAGAGMTAMAIGPELGGFDGLLVGFPAYNQGSGLLVAYDQSGNKKWQIKGNDGEALGTALTSPVDLDGDKLARVAIGAPGYAKGRGALYLLDGFGKLTRAVVGGGKGFGRVLSAPGDIDGDGITDLVVASPDELLPNGTSPGVLTVLSSSSTK